MVNIMRMKLKANSRQCVKLRKEKIIKNKLLIDSLGGKTRQDWKIVKEVKKNGEDLRKKLSEKNQKKVNRLTEKYELKYEIVDELTKDEQEKYGMVEIFNNKVGLSKEKLREPEIVGEGIVLSEEELNVLALGPKFCVRKKLSMEEFDTELEECIAKIRWEMMGEEIDKKKQKKDDANIAIMAILDDEEKEEVREHEEAKEAKLRQVYNVEENSWNYGRKRATDLKGNTMVILPGQSKDFQVEANFEMLRTEIRACFKNYTTKNCNEKGDQESNLSRGEMGGLKKLKKCYKSGELAIKSTDKSGRFAVMSQENYITGGGKHTQKAEEIDLETIKQTQKELKMETLA